MEFKPYDLSSFWLTMLYFGIYLTIQRYILISVTLFIQKSQFGKSRFIFTIPVPKGQKKRELALSILPFLLDAFCAAALTTSGLVKWSDTSSWQILVASFAFHFIMMEFLFYSSHRLLHTKRFFQWHRDHHLSKVTTPFTSQSFHIIERYFLNASFQLPFIFWNLMFGQVPLLTMGLAFLVSDFFNICLGHSNMEVYPKWYSKSFLFNLISVPSSHALHHARSNGNYGLNTPFFDKIFGTLYKDTADVMVHVQNQGGFAKLDAKIRTEAPTPETEQVLKVAV